MDNTKLNMKDRVDHEIIDELIFLNKKKENFLNKQIKLFLENTDDLIKKIQNSLLSNNRNEISNFAHSLKGASASMGAINLAKLCQCMEIVSEKNTDQEINLILKDIITERDSFVLYLKLFEKEQN
jgi:HPt (histidine-containing phosphotransfer) domain-containing protein